MTTEKEDKRLHALQSYQIPASETRPEFDDLTTLAASICEAPVTMINLIDDKDQWSKSIFGISEWHRRMPRNGSICQYTIQKNRLFEVSNLKKDDRFKDLPYVKSKPHFTYYLGAPLADPNGNIIGVLCVLDYKERKASTNQKNQLKILAKQVMAHFELTKQNFELHELNKHKMNLMKILSHDIRSPLGGIIGMSSLLTETVEFDDPDTMQILQILAQSARQMNVMINDILNYTIMEAKGFTLNLKQTDIRYIVENIKKLYKPTAALKDIDLKFQVRNIENALLLDSEKFEQIFGNLLSNAIKFSHQGGIVQSIIELETIDTDTRHLILSVRDNGIGMHKNMLNNLFVNHTDNDRPGTTGEKSTGLGLSIIKHFTDLHNGKITVSSTPEKGTVFTIRFPL